MMCLHLTTYGKAPIITVGGSSRWHWASPALTPRPGESTFPLATATWTCSYQACFLNNSSLHPVCQVKCMWHRMICHRHTECFHVHSNMMRLTKTNLALKAKLSKDHVVRLILEVYVLLFFPPPVLWTSSSAMSPAVSEAQLKMT